MLIDAVNRYIQLRRVGGYKFHVQGNLLRSFATFASARGDERVRTTTAVEWAALGSSLEARHVRLQTVIVFARHGRAEDSGHELPPSGVFGGKNYSRHPVAHIFSPEEIRLILEFALKLRPKASLRPHTAHTLFGLLAAAGLRVSEALRLRRGDLTPDGLFIRETKFRKSRIVPIHPTTRRALSTYIALRVRIAGDGDDVFVGMDGERWSRQAASVALHEAVSGAGLTAVRRGKSPRLHDFRHTWAVRALEASPHEVDKIDRHVRAVTTYLGHVSVATGFWYLHSTPFLMKRIADACAEREART
jgi:integrase